MKVLYAIQGTGNGHLCRALDIIPALREKADVDILISGIQGDIDLPYEVKFRLKGLSFIFGKKGGVDLYQTFARNKTRRLWNEIRRLPVAQYDLVINDFEPVSAWAARLRGIPCFALSHQAAVLDPLAPLPAKKDLLGRFILKRYAPAEKKFGFHFSSLGTNVFTPVIRRQVRQLKISDQGHYTVYLPSYSDAKLVSILSQFPAVQWRIFSKHNRKAKSSGSILIQPVHNERFLESLAASAGIICGAGFETPAEALFLKKKLLVVPMKNQYEQHCNAAALKSLGVPVLKNLKKKQLNKIGEWLENGAVLKVDYQDHTAQVIELVFKTYQQQYGSATALSLTEGFELT